MAISPLFMFTEISAESRVSLWHTPGRNTCNRNALHNIGIVYKGSLGGR